MEKQTFLDDRVTLHIGDSREILYSLEPESVNCIVTSPPYFGLRDYGMGAQIGLEKTPDEFVSELVSVFREARRVLRDDGTLWLNLGDSYSGSGKCVWNANDERKSKVKETYRPSTNPIKTETGLKPKDMIGIPWRVAFALQADGWYLRQDIIWHKPNPMPESVKDRCTKAHEFVFMLSKSPRYYYDAASIAEPATYSGIKGQDASGYNDAQAFQGKHREKDKQRGHPRRHAGFNERWDNMTRKEQGAGMRNKRSVWSIATRPFSDAHFATMAPKLAETCILAGCPKGGIVLDPFGGAGTTALVALRQGRKAALIELNPEYAKMARKRIETEWKAAKPSEPAKMEGLFG